MTLRDPHAALTHASFDAYCAKIEQRLSTLESEVAYLVRENHRLRATVEDLVGNQEGLP